MKIRTRSNKLSKKRGRTALIFYLDETTGDVVECRAAYRTGRQAQVLQGKAELILKALSGASLSNPCRCGKKCKCNETG